MKLPINFAALALLALATAAPPACADTAPEGCRLLQLHGHATEAQTCFDTLTRSNSPYYRAEGYWGLEQYSQANEEFRIATAAPDAPALYKVRWGMLLHERFNNKDAVDLFNEDLQKDPTNAQAYIGLALVSADGFDDKAAEYAAKAAKLAPKLSQPHELLATIALENGDTPTALTQADQAISLSPDALNALAIHAAIELNADRSPDAWFAKIRAINPNYGEAYAIVAHDLEMHYRYEDAVVYYRKAVDTDPHLWSARSKLGVDLMRLGRQDEAAQQLELCYNNDYRDNATVNSLRLIDSYKNFVTIADNTTILRLNKNEANLLRPYFQTELHTILATYEMKYKMKLPAPVQVEVYPNHEDFAVRTLGMPGLGALGVTFGEVIAMDSPSGRKPGDFNWGSTLWHEMSHVFILTATNHRVPRWFTEGLAVHEQSAHNPEWRDSLTPDVLVAIRDKKLLPVANLDRGFVYPEYPTQVFVSYFEAGSICDYIQQRWGDDALLGMVHSFAQLKSTPDAIQQNLKLSADDFDKQYLTWIDNKYGKLASNFDQWHSQLKNLVDFAEQKKYDSVITEGAAVRDLYPEYVGEANAYEYLAEAYLSKNDNAAAVKTLTDYEKFGGSNPAALKQLATLEVEAGNSADAAATLARINYIYPMDESLHRRLGDLYLSQSNYPAAIREYSAVVALNPLDKAGSQYNLAQAYLAAGQKDKAESADILALEAAPGYRPAQKLLLQIEQPNDTSPAKQN